ncbi:MAG: putative zinc-binding protein [Brevinematia bacterium]
MPKENWQKLPMCHKEAEKLSIILVCDGAASVGQVGHEVGVKLTKDMPEEARMCCLAAVAAGSKPHVEIAQKAKRLIAINGCANKCTSKILANLNIKPHFEYTIVEKVVEKVPTLDFDEADVERIANEISKEIEAHL